VRQERVPSPCASVLRAKACSVHSRELDVMA
jgi:hypothetical protein